MTPRLVNDTVFWYMQELTSRIVAQSGIPSDRHHLGKIILQSLKDAPDFVLQIDGATGESETCGSVLERSVRCAKSMRNLGLKKGDLMILMATCNLDVTVPLYAALYLGIIVVAIDKNMSNKGLQAVLSRTKPAIMFCQSDVASRTQSVLSQLEMKPHMVTFGKSDGFCNFGDFMDNGDDKPMEDFKCSDFDPKETLAFLVATSGTTGLPKLLAHSHEFFSIILPYIWIQFNKFPTPTPLAMLMSPLQWSTALTSFIRAPVIRYTRLQTSETMTTEHARHLIKKYKPSYAIMTPTWVSIILKAAQHRDHNDFMCFELIMICGSIVPQDLIDEVKAISPNTNILNIFGMSELAGLALYGDNPAPGSCGKPMGCFQYRIIDTETEQDIHEPNVPGELWIKGPCPFKGCYNDIESTEAMYTKDGWLKSGDIFYRDENWNFFYVDRIKLQMKTFHSTYSPLELETVIRKHPGVLDVAVVSVPHRVWGDLPVACVVPLPGAKLDADEIKDLVKDSLDDRKRLRGGVIFIDSMPMTASTKVHRQKLKEMAQVLPRV